MDQYEFQNKVGSGAFGVVFRAKHKETGDTVAIKTLTAPQNSLLRTHIREISLLLELKHPNVVRILDNFTSDGKMNLVLEYVPRNLDDYIGHKYKNLRKPFLRQILVGVAYCHGLGVIHRDLKPSNILVDPSTNPPTLKLGDFGGARGFINSNNALTPKVGAIGYIAPEVHLGMSEYSMEVDMWAVGCIFYEMARFSPLFKPKSKEDELLVIFRLLGTPDEDSWPGVTLLPNYNSRIRKFPKKNLENQLSDLEPDGVDLLQKMLSLDPSKRISAEHALDHPYFREEDSS